eukprot:CAMPEP_0177780932 /NCGR_PEP_ID=MMETSP0491_2-20121128/17531_1 /TAXON_ID=63592 /ORGANISM="Tetraselmis chuii, Strain PLY429" /LENGTH=69 /DNA_ID=CAMNT_0019300865 /DNA_START=114 /DNA_END=323 /DNA_ORIENTATION=-
MIAHQRCVDVVVADDGSGASGSRPDTHRQLEWLIQCQPLSGGRQAGSHMLTTITPDGIHIATAITACHS